MIRNILESVLYHQYVENPRSGTIHQVLVGSGQGQRNSGSVSDFCFYKLVEESLLCECCAPRYNILRYMRYRDDILFIACDWSDIQPFMDALTAKASRCWEVEVDACSALCVPMLNILVLKEKHGPRSSMAWRPYR